MYKRQRFHGSLLPRPSRFAPSVVLTSCGAHPETGTGTGAPSTSRASRAAREQKLMGARVRPDARAAVLTGMPLTIVLSGCVRVACLSVVLLCRPVGAREVFECVSFVFCRFIRVLYL